MKTKAFIKSAFIAAMALLSGPWTRETKAQSLEPFNPYGIFTPSVEAWQMTRYGNLTPSLYTGAMTFSLPLYVYEDPHISIPVSWRKMPLALANFALKSISVSWAGVYRSLP